MIAFVTGGTGFIGSRVVQRLTNQGYDVTCLVRRLDKATRLQELGATLVEGDITDRESMRPGMEGADLLFHCAAWYEVGISPGARGRMEQVNVEGTENVLGLATMLGVSKIIYTSTATVLGDTRSIIVDESHRRNSPFVNTYDRTKFQAHQLAERYIAQGAPIIIVMPAGVYGPGDHSIIGMLVRMSLRRMALVMPGADTGHSFVHVDDVAQGHVLAAEKGRVGESYILGGDVLTFGDLLQVVARLAGVPAPVLLLDSSLIAPLSPLTAWLERFMPLPPVLSSEMLNSLGSTWWFSSAKAAQELGYNPRPIEEGMAETVTREVAKLYDQPAVLQTKSLVALSAVAFILGLLLVRGRRTHP